MSMLMYFSVLTIEQLETQKLVSFSPFAKTIPDQVYLGLWNDQLGKIPDVQSLLDFWLYSNKKIKK